MKKTMITLAAMFAATVSMAAVTSQTVGYATRQMDTQAGEFMLNVGLCFKPMTVSGQFEIADSGLGIDFTTGDGLYVFNPTSWDLDIYTYNGLGEGWFVAWADGSTSTIPSFTLPESANVFYAGAATSVTVSGEVEASGTVEVVFTPDENNFMFPITNPFPVVTTLGDLEGFVAAGDGIYVFNPMNWDIDIYTYNGVGEGWFVAWSDGTTDTISDAGRVIFPVACGGFYMPSGPTTWAVTLNY